MTKYRKKPVVIEAEQYTKGMEGGFSCIPFVSECRWKDENGYYKQCQKCKLNIPKKPYIVTFEGHDYIDEGDWIITDMNGIRYPIKPDIFEETYELVESDQKHVCGPYIDVDVDVIAHRCVKCGKTAIYEVNISTDKLKFIGMLEAQE